MYTMIQWILKWYAHYRLLREQKKREAERQIQREKQDYEHGRALQLILHKLQDIMDPLIASQVYNNSSCPLTRLPEELLLNVLEFLHGDGVTLYCLRITSRTFFRILHGPRGFWTRSMDFEFIYLEPGPLLELLRLLLRDGRCENCRRWNDTYIRSTHNCCKFQRCCGRNRPTFFAGEYGHTDYAKPYCSACDTNHNVCEFPMAYHKPPEFQPLRPQLCLGQQGSVRLCEHVHITWASIKAHIEDWRCQKQASQGGAGAGNKWQEWIDSFQIECHDAIHDIRCTASEAPTRPRARLGIDPMYSFQGVDILVLYLEWTPHARIDALQPTKDGRIPAQELRALFRKFRQLGPADSLYPPGYPGNLPEMACLGPSFPIYYKMGQKEEKEEDAESTSPPRPSPFLPTHLNQRHMSLGCGKLRLTDVGRNSRTLDIRSHDLSGSSGHGIECKCLTVSYQEKIMVCYKSALSDPTDKLVPSDHWLHAMDTHTYPAQQAKQFRPLCNDKSCKNYH